MDIFLLKYIILFIIFVSLSIYLSIYLDKDLKVTTILNIAKPFNIHDSMVAKYKIVPKRITVPVIINTGSVKYLNTEVSYSVESNSVILKLEDNTSRSYDLSSVLGSYYFRRLL